MVREARGDVDGELNERIGVTGSHVLSYAWRRMHLHAPALSTTSWPEGSCELWIRCGQGERLEERIFVHRICEQWCGA